MNSIVQELLELDLPEQRTPEWYKQRLTRITASEAASCLFRSQNTCKNYVDTYNVNIKYNVNIGINPYEKLEDYIIKKCKSSYESVPFINSDATLWGKKYEPVATRLYTLETNQHVYEFGLVPHQQLEWLAASPDGITENGTMLEIKCPKSRKIDSIPPLYYWIQTQIQLEVCNLQKCDFLECEIKEISEEEFLELEHPNTNEYGIILQTPQTTAQIKEKCDFQLVYPPNIKFDKSGWINWANQQLQVNGNLIKIYYVINKWNIITINRDTDWFDKVKSDLKSTWNKIINLQSDRFLLDSYIQSINDIKNKEFIAKFSSTVCLISTNDLESQFYISQSEDEFDDCICLI